MNAGGPRGYEARVGAVLDKRYKIEAVLGVGGVGGVYQVLHLGLGRRMALKILHEELGEHEEIRRRFEREARLLSTLEHPQVVRVTDFGYVENVAYLAMELLEGETLVELLERGIPDADDVIDITIQILKGLSFAHSRGVLHRDLKPGNVFLVDQPDDSRLVKLLDFGMAKMIDPGPDGGADATLTKMGTVLGTPSYMSPEQAASSSTDARTDIYSVGIMLYEMLTDRVPFIHENRLEILRAHLTKPVPEPCEMRPGLGLGPELEAILKRALEKRRDMRFSSADEMREALEALDRPAATFRNDGVIVRTERPSQGSITGDESTISITSSMIEQEQALGSSVLVKRRRSRVWVALWLFGVLVVIGLGVSVGYALFGGPTEPDEAPSTPPDESSTPTQRDDHGPSQPEQAPAEPTAPEQGEPEQPGPEPQTAGRPRAVDPFREVPRALLPYYRGVRKGRALSRSQMRKLMSYQQKHPADPRPSLLLAHDFVKRVWYGNALKRYGRAYGIDPSCRGARWMLTDLIKIAETRSNGDLAADAIARFYGDEALGGLDRALGRKSLKEGARVRLERLRKRLSTTAP